MVKKDDYYMDGYLDSNLTIYEKDVTKRDDDCCMVVDGGEGGGKSTLAGQIAKRVDKTYNLDRCVFTPDQLFHAIKNAKKFQAIVFDEAFGYLNSRQAMSKFNRDIIKVLAEMRFKNLFLIIVLPSFFELDRYPAIHRSRCLVHIYKDSQTGLRGKFCFWNFHKKKILYLYGKKGYNYNCVSASFYGQFSKHFVYDKEAYNKKKEESIFSMFEPDIPAPRVQKDVKRFNALLYHLNKVDRISFKNLSKLLGKYGYDMPWQTIRDRVSGFVPDGGSLLS